MKKKIIFLIVFILGVFNQINAQDTIVFKNNELKTVKVTVVKSDELTCKEFTNLEGPDYIYALKKIKEVRFQNGIVQQFNIPDDEIEYVNDVAVRKYQEVETNNESNIKPLNTFKERSEYYKGVPYRREFGDPYNLWAAGIASYFIPGLGQMISGETGRGFAFLGGFSAAYVVTLVGISNIYTEPYWNNNNHYGNSSAAMFTIGGGIAMLGIYIWSIVDAVNVARVNNLYERDLRNSSQLNFQLSPYVDVSKPTLSLNNQPALGLSLKVSF